MLDPSPAQVVELKSLDTVVADKLDYNKVKSVKVRHIAKAHDDCRLAVIKEYRGKKSKPKYPSIIEIHGRIKKNESLKLLRTIIEDGCITGVVWINSGMLLVVSEQLTINIYRVSTGKRLASVISDYGPIRCARYDNETRVLVTGTDYGNVVVYHITGKKDGFIEPLCKMIKVNNAITSIDIMIHKREHALQKKTIPALSSKIAVKSNKRKRVGDSSDDESDLEEEVAEVELVEFLSDVDLTIYGASRHEINVWDYHKRSIVDTIRLGDESCLVTSMLVLPNGSLIAGDTEGRINLFDENTLIMKQEFKLLKTPVTCLACDSKGESLLASSDDGGTIVRLQKKTAPSDEYVSFESIENDNHDVTSMAFLSKSEFVTGSKDGVLIYFKYSEGKLHRNEVSHSFEHILETSSPEKPSASEDNKISTE